MKNLLFLVRRSLRQHLLSTLVTIAATALAAGLVMSVFVIERQTRDAFTGGEIGFDAVLGARGSQLQLVLNSVFHLETSPGNIPWTLYHDIRKNPFVELAVPYAVGDNYRGFRIVGTTEQMFADFEFRKGEKFQLARGQWFHPDFRYAVIGSRVAEESGLDLGGTFKPIHGMEHNPSAEHDVTYRVVGVLEPTNTPSDRVIWIPIEGIWRMEGHALAEQEDGTRYVAKAGEEIPDEFKEISAVMIKFKGDAGGGPAAMQLHQSINLRGKAATLAWPIGNVMAELFKKLGWAVQVLRLVAYLVVLVATGAILASIYNTMNERRREFAILRALGARRRTVFGAIVLEASAIAFLGAVAGYLVYGLVLFGTARVVRAETGVVIDLWAGHEVLWRTPLAMGLLGAVAGLLPARKAYATDVASNLLPAS